MSSCSVLLEHRLDAICPPYARISCEVKRNSPTTGEPFASREGLQPWSFQAVSKPWAFSRYVPEKGIAFSGSLVPIVLTIDGLGQFRTAALINTTSVDPDTGESVLVGLIEQVFLFLQAFRFAMQWSIQSNVIESYLLINGIPSMREYSIVSVFGIVDFPELVHGHLKIARVHFLLVVCCRLHAPLHALTYTSLRQAGDQNRMMSLHSSCHLNRLCNGCENTTRVFRNSFWDSPQPGALTASAQPPYARHRLKAPGFWQMRRALYTLYM